MKITDDVLPLAGHDPEIGLLLSTLVNSTEEWRENLDRPEVAAITWQAVPDGPSIGSLILHLIDCEISWFENVAAGLPRNEDEANELLSEEVQQYSGVWPIPPAKPIEWYFELHDRGRARCFETIKGIAPDRLYEGQTRSFTMRWIVAHIVHHDSYHGGQAVLLHEAWKKTAKASN